MEKCLLVPHDFTEVGDYAIEHAYKISEKANLPIHVLHIVNKKKEIEEAEKKLNSIVEKFKAENNVLETEFIISVRKGNLYKQIYKYGCEVDTCLAIMGTHGIKNIKKAMKVIKKFVKIPFIIIQSPAKNINYKNILLPIDTDKASRIKVYWANFLNSLFKSKVFIISHEEKETSKVRDLTNNINFAENYFEEELIDFDFHILPTGKHFSDEIYNYARTISVDVILLMTNKYREYIKSLKNSENLEMYKEIPIMCVNKRVDIFKQGGFN